VTPPPVEPPVRSADGATVVVHVRLGRGARGRRHLVAGSPDPVPALAVPQGRVPRVARMLALAHRWQGLIRAGTVRDQVELARLVGVSRARVTQVMDLLRLAPDIQEAVLGLPLVTRGRDPHRHRELRLIAAELPWATQRRRWQQLTTKENPDAIQA